MSGEDDVKPSALESPANINLRQGKGLLCLQQVQVGTVLVFFLVYLLYIFFLILSGRLKCNLIEPFNPNQLTNQIFGVAKALVALSRFQQNCFLTNRGRVSRG